MGIVCNLVGAAQYSPHMSSRIVASFVLIASALACGGASRPAGAIFTAEELMLFGNGADYAQDPEALGGDWKAQWEKDQRTRVELADMVAIVKVNSVSADETSGDDPYIRLVADLVTRLFGKAEQEITLRVEQTDPGYASIEGKERSLLAQPFVLTLRWQRLGEDSDVVEPRWHLTPATDSVIEFVQGSIDAAHGGSRAGAHGSRKVVIHDNE